MNKPEEHSDPAPVVSVLVPNYNNAAYLRERFDTILAQTLTAYEVIVCDSYSTDGAWELIQSYVAKDSRIKACQVPKKGIYAGWNDCIRRATGKYIYIATSDDTMATQCLERLVAALIAHPECSVAMCGLDIIDSRGIALPADKNWRSYPAGRFFKNRFDDKHIRRKPLDGVLSASLHCIWHSATQLLVRREVYERNGLYRTDLGSIADFEWNTRVALNESVVYVPDVMATLRVHHQSASVQRGGYSVFDIREKRNILELVKRELAGKSPELFTRLGNAGWTDAFLFQEAIYTLKEKRFSAWPALSKIWNLSSRDWELLLRVVTVALFGKERVRRVFTEALLCKMRMKQNDYIVVI